MKLITNPRNSCKEFRKVLHIMRITLLLLLFVTYGWANEATYAQVTEIHLSSGNKTLQEVFSEIEGKNRIYFFFIMTMRLTCLKSPCGKSLTVL